MKRIVAQTRIELLLTLRRGESLLVLIGIPVLILVFFSLVDVLPHGPGRSVDFLVPGVIALSVIAGAMTSLGIATGFERHAGVLRLLGATPLGRGGLLGAKIISLVAVAFLQIAAVVLVGAGLGWRPSGLLPAVFVIALGTICFAGLGFFLAGRLRAETNLAVCNALFLIFLLLGGVIVPVGSLPENLAAVARLVPAEPLATSLRAALSGLPIDVRALVTLSVWSVLSSVAAIRYFRWS